MNWCEEYHKISGEDIDLCFKRDGYIKDRAIRSLGPSAKSALLTLYSCPLVIRHRKDLDNVNAFCDDWLAEKEEEEERKNLKRSREEVFSDNDEEMLIPEPKRTPSPMPEHPSPVRAGTIGPTGAAPKVQVQEVEHPLGAAPEVQVEDDIDLFTPNTNEPDINNQDNYQNADEYFGTYDEELGLKDHQDQDIYKGVNYIYEGQYNKDGTYKGIITASLDCADSEKRYRIELIREYFDRFTEENVQYPVLRYYFAGLGWRTFVFNDDNLNDFYDTLDNFGVYNRNQIESAAFSTYYNEGELPNIDFVQAIQILDYPLKQDDRKEYKTKAGEFYPYYINDDGKKEFVLNHLYLAQIFTSLFDDLGELRKEFKYNCFCYALYQAKCPKELLDCVRSLAKGRYQKMSDLNDICKTLKICVEVRFDINGKKDKTHKNILGDPNNYVFKTEMYLIREEGMKGDHYFYDKEIQISTFFYLHYNEICEYARVKNKDINSMLTINKYDKSKNLFRVDKSKPSTSKLSDLLKFVKKQGWLSPYTLKDTLALDCDLSSYVLQTLASLEYQDCCCKLITYTEKECIERDQIDEIFYADFEASTQGFHKPYCVSYVNRNEDDIITIYDQDCAKELLERLPNKSLVFFHNLGYDGRFLAKHGVCMCVKKGGKIMSMRLNYRNKTLYFRDSYSMITSPLAKFPSMFNIPKVQKELYPYNYYTQERVLKNVGIINEAGKYEIVAWNEDKYKIFNENIDNIPNCRIDENTFDMKLYCKFYCEQDVRILKLGHTKFRELVLKELNLDIDDSITICSLANKYFRKNVFSKIPEMYEYCGIPRHYIQGCVKGGRCMTRDNKKWHTNKKLYDYDACSLYPSAVYRLKLATGKPKVIPENWCGNSKELLNHLMDEQQLEPTKDKYISAFIVDIDITKIGKNLHFPIIMQKTKEGNRNVNECCSMRVDNIELEDLIKFQQIEYTIKQGYYWEGVKSDVFSNEMHRIYQLRKEYKKQHNPLQEVLKLLMNSTYGKTIQKPIETKCVYKQKERTTKNGKIRYDADAYTRKNARLIKEFYDIGNGITCFEVKESFDKFFVPNLVGVQILTMSKRIMNEVMCLAEDLGIEIYYQDTDSMHIPCEDLPKLEAEYEKLYGRVLRGTEMGQFHPDFESNKINGDLYAVESIFLGKKAYVDKLTNGKEYDHHLRLKGIPNELLATEYSDPMVLYKKLYDGEAYKFNLLKLKPSFEMNKNMTIKSRLQFNRVIKF